MTRPPRLRPGDTVGIVSPCWGDAGVFPHRVEKGVKQLEALGFPVRIAAHALVPMGYSTDPPEDRVRDIHDMFRDPEVRAIVSAIGGDHSCRLLPLLDYHLIARNPKIFMGFSDITVLNIAIWVQTGLTTFNGPARLTDFAEHPRMFDYTERYMLRTLCQAEPLGLIEPSTWWTEEFLDWEQKLDLRRPRKQETTTGWTWLRSGASSGFLVGGCLESLEHLRGTRFWPRWDGVVLFFEIAGWPPLRVDSILMDYDNMGVFEAISGLIVGRPLRYTDEQRNELREVILERTSKFSFPIITDMDFGHTSSQFTIPIGCRCRIDTGAQRFEIVEAAVE